MTTATSRRSAPRSWLALGPASRMLGVDPDTLRRWADDGRVQVYVTPGGHRRFERSAIERLATERRPGTGHGPRRPPERSLASLGATPERLQRAYRRTYVTPTPYGVDPLDDADRSAYRLHGRHLVTALVAYLDADPTDTDARERAEAQATSLVDELAARLAATDVSLTESVAVFVAARRPFLAELAGLGRRRALDPVRLAVVYEDASSLLDRLLLRLIDDLKETRG